MSKKEKFALYLTPEKKALLERRYQEDGSRSLTGFIERAIDFYLDYLSAGDAGLFLPASVKSCLDGRLDQLEDRLAALAFRQAVETDLVAGILADTCQLSREELRRRGIACAGTPMEQGKLTAPAIDGWETMADFVLVEADGSAGRPFKAHADWEPVLPEERQATVLVMGADGFGKPISRMAHRPELYARLAGATEDQEVTPELAARVVRLECLHDRVFLNQVDRAEEWPLARRLAAVLDCPVTAGTLREGRWQRLK